MRKEYREDLLQHYYSPIKIRKMSAW